MLLIKKGREPASLTKYRKTKGAPPPCYDSAPAEVKNDIRKALLRDQGCLCAYCMREISVSDMKIEHVRPRSVDYLKGNPAGTLDYRRNLLGVCDEKRYARGQDGEMLDKKYFTCDAKKDQGMEPEHYTPLAVDPTNPKHIGSISYRTASGAIFSSIPEIDADLNGRLNLNCEKQCLPQNRREVWEKLRDHLKEEMGKGDWSAGKLEKFLKNYSSVDGEGKLPEYAGIVLWYIRKKMKSTRRR